MTEHLDRAQVKLDANETEERARSHMESCSIVLLDDQRAGMIKVVRQPDFSKIVQLQIEPTLQGQGIGGALLTEVVADAKLKGLVVQLSVLKDNPAKRLYERLGFKVVGEGTLEYDMQAEV